MCWFAVFLRTFPRLKIPICESFCRSVPSPTREEDGYPGMFGYYTVVWYGMVWYGMVWYGVVWYGMVW